MTDFDPAVYAQSALVQGIKWMFVIVPVLLLSLTLVFAFRYKLNNKRFDTVLKGVALLKEGKDLVEKMSAEEIEDIELVTGVQVHNLWAHK